MILTSLECRVLEAGPLSTKGVKAVIDCKLSGVDQVTVKGVSQAKSFLSSILPLSGLGEFDIVFSENENIGDRFMLYKFSIQKGTVRMGTARLVTEVFKPLRLVITLSNLLSVGGQFEASWPEVHSVANSLQSSRPARGYPGNL